MASTSLKYAKNCSICMGITSSPIEETASHAQPLIIDHQFPLSTTPTHPHPPKNLLLLRPPLLPLLSPKYKFEKINKITPIFR